jgi:dTDP-4-dehydrorhamnose reductase
MLGRDVMAELGAVHQVLPFPKEALDITDAEQVDRVVGQVAPDLIINCAAYTDVDGCESHRQASLAVNALGPRNVALAATRHHAALLHISTDYVFNGQADVPYTEFEPVAPVTAYGVGKLAGEEAVRTHAPRHFILRTAWLYGAHGPNFVHTMLRLAAEKDALTVVDDQVGNPTWTRDLARVIGQLIETDAYGTYHATAEGQVSWYGFCQEIFRIKGVSTPVSPVTSDQFPRPAKRPAFSGLENFCLKARGIQMRPWNEALAEFLAKKLADHSVETS